MSVRMEMPAGGWTKVKRGRIRGVVRTGQKFIQVMLEDGQKVEIPIALANDMVETFGADRELVFVEAKGRTFHYVHWVGTEESFAKEFGAGTPQTSGPTPPTQRSAISNGSGFLRRLATYVAFSAAVFALIAFFRLPDPIPVAYLGIASIGFLLMLGDLIRGR